MFKEFYVKLFFIVFGGFFFLIFCGFEEDFLFDDCFNFDLYKVFEGFIIILGYVIMVIDEDN